MNKRQSKNPFPENKKSKIWVDNNGVVNVVVASQITEDDVTLLVEKIKETLRGISGKTRVLIDISTTSIIHSYRFRKRTADQIREAIKYPGIGKAAIFGGGVIMKTIASFIVVASGVENIRIFEKKEKALNWLLK